MGYTEETHNTHADGVTILDQMFADEGDTTEMVRLARERHRLALHFATSAHVSLVRDAATDLAQLAASGADSETITAAIRAVLDAVGDLGRGARRQATVERRSR